MFVQIQKETEKSKSKNKIEYFLATFETQIWLRKTTAPKQSVEKLLQVNNYGNNNYQAINETFKKFFSPQILVLLFLLSILTFSLMDFERIKNGHL